MQKYKQLKVQTILKSLPLTMTINLSGIPRGCHLNELFQTFGEKPVLSINVTRQIIANEQIYDDW